MVQKTTECFIDLTAEMNMFSLDFILRKYFEQS